jgi:hypothetical protein
MAQGTNVITIDSGQTISSVYNLNGNSLMGIFTPDTLTSSSFNIQGSVDNTTWGTLTSPAGTQLSFTASVNALVYFLPATTSSANYIRIVGNSSEAADRSFTIVTKLII